METTISNNNVIGSEEGEPPPDPQSHIKKNILRVSSWLSVSSSDPGPSESDVGLYSLW